ncbi:MAG: DNA polymerase III subunit gamma/tau [Treponema sp.]|jgi:DNA polymerase-3 subunit gamma/tau|nr:DNA polymerase III subunit gamma/tau [Treponema sp.]
MAETTALRYEITATRYRPKTFDELAGQEFVVSTLKNSLKSGHIAHAYLFSGPRGCGKTSAARILARSLNCEKGPAEGGPCGVCDNCIAISYGASMDVLEIDGASNNSVNDVRQIKDEVLFPPQAGHYKVYIIDEVHMLSGSAFNALLKTIEEPPPYIVFIFATTELHKVPATIKSRCQQFNFRLISVEVIQEILKRICAENGITAEDDALFWIARESTGSMRDAFTLFDQVVSFSAGNIRGDLIIEKLGLIGLERLNALAESCAANDAAGAFALTDEILASGIAEEQFVIDLAGYYRSLLLLKNGVTRESLLDYRPAQFSKKALDAFDSIRIEQALDILLGCYRDIRYSVSPRFELEAAVSKLSWLNKWVTYAELKEAVEDARSVLGNPARRINYQNNAQKQVETVLHDEAAGPPVSNPGGSSQPSSSSARSLSDEFKRMISAREASASAGLRLSSESSVEEDEDVPFWNSAAHKEGEHAQMPPQVERVLSVIPGTIIE